jgi:hypothetical protein
MQLRMVQKDHKDGWYFFSFSLFGFHIYHNPNTKISMFVNTLTLFGILQNSGLPWIEPKKALSFDFGSLTDTINEVIGVCTLYLSTWDCNIQCWCTWKIQLLVFRLQNSWKNPLTKYSMNVLKLSFEEKEIWAFSNWGFLQAKKDT